MSALEVAKTPTFVRRFKKDLNKIGRRKLGVALLCFLLMEVPGVQAHIKNTKLNR